MFNHCPPPEQWANAVLVRCKLEGLTEDEIEARIARWEALESAYYCCPAVYDAVNQAHKPETVEHQLFLPEAAKVQRQHLPPTFAKHAAAQALQPTINAELAKAQIAGNRCGKGAAPVLICAGCGGINDAGSHCASCAAKESEEVISECGCGGPAGHVPNGMLCRKGM